MLLQLCFYIRLSFVLISFSKFDNFHNILHPSFPDPRSTFEEQRKWEDNYCDYLSVYLYTHSFCYAVYVDGCLQQGEMDHLFMSLENPLLYASASK